MKEPKAAPRLRRRIVTPAVVISIGVAAAVCVLVVGAGAWAFSVSRATGATPEKPRPASFAQRTTVTPGTIEMPELVGLSLEEAETVLSATGLVVTVRAEGSAGAKGIETVISQRPAAGVLADAGGTVTIVTRMVEPSGTTASKAGSKKRKRAERFVVCIDPGHQAHSDSTPEPIGPGSKKVKPSVSGGTTGTQTDIPEYEIALQVSMNLKKRLEARGVKVVMTRTTNDVNLSNSQRAAIANKAKADLFVRIHADGSPDAHFAGFSTLYPASNRWTASIAPESKLAAKLVQASAIRSTGAVDRGIVRRGDLAGFNWSNVPAVLVECGFMSNPVEDRLLASPHYQDKIATGIADGALDYLLRSRR